MGGRKLYLITYVENGDEYVEEVPAYSIDQAKYLASCPINKIVDVAVSVCNMESCCNMARV